MSSIVIEGGKPLKGTVKISSAKNAVLPVIAASLLTESECIIEDAPELEDVKVMREVLRSMGAKVCREGDSIKIGAGTIDSIEAPYDLIRKMRASFLVMGPMLARKGRARISMPGGCAIGSRPIDLHLKGFASLGAEIVWHGYVDDAKLVGSTIYLDFPCRSYREHHDGAKLHGQTITEMPQEPEIIDLANFLNSMGARIRGAAQM